MAGVLVADDAEYMRDFMASLLRAWGHSVDQVADLDTALTRVRDHAYDLVLADLRFDATDGGFQVLDEIQRRGNDTAVLIVTAYASVETAVLAIKRGAFDYVVKPFSTDRFRLSVEKALDDRRLRRRVRLLEDDPIAGPIAEASLLGQGPAMVELRKLVERAAGSNATVLLLGETGTGKNLVARTIHRSGLRNRHPFVTVDCGAVPETLLESEFFGHVKGAFTGAHESRRGLFEEADGGTVFLDEIGEMPVDLQSKLLRFLERGEFRPVGHSGTRRSDARVMAATHRNLDAAIRDGRFRADLFYRLNVLPIRVPPLRDRPEDVPLLAGRLLERLAQRLHSRVRAFDEPALEQLAAYGWPGNVRELENVVERAVILSDGPIILSEHLMLPDASPAPAGAPAESRELPTLAEVQRRHIAHVLRQVDGHRREACRVLGISKATLWRKMHDMGLLPTRQA